MGRFLCAIHIVFIAAAAHAQMVVQHDDQTVTIRAEGVPIATLLAEIARVHPLERVTIQAGVEQRPVSIVRERVDPRTALVAILRASGLDFALSGRRVMVGDWTGPTRAVPTNDGAPALASSGAVDPPASERETRQRADAQEAERQAAERAAVAAADLVALQTATAETAILPMPPVQFIADGENITYLEPNFVPYKMRPHVRALRMAIDVATIP